MTEFVAKFILDIISRIISSISTTYVIRFFDRFMHKNNRQSE